MQLIITYHLHPANTLNMQLFVICTLQFHWMKIHSMSNHMIRSIRWKSDDVVLQKLCVHQPEMRWEKSLIEKHSQIEGERGVLLETKQLPRGLKTYMMAVTQGLWNSGIEVWCDNAAYSVLMLEKLTKLGLCFCSTPVFLCNALCSSTRHTCKRMTFPLKLKIILILIFATHLNTSKEILPEVAWEEERLIIIKVALGHVWTAFTLSEQGTTLSEPQVGILLLAVLLCNRPG